MTPTDSYSPSHSVTWVFNDEWKEAERSENRNEFRLGCVSCRLPPRYVFHFLDDTTEEPVVKPMLAHGQAPPSSAHPFPARVVSNRRVTAPGHFQDVRHIEFDITDSNIQWVVEVLMYQMNVCLWVCEKIWIIWRQFCHTLLNYEFNPPKNRVS